MLNTIKIVNALDYASGTADRTGAAIDTYGYQGVVMVVKTAAIAAGGTNSIKAQQATASAFSTPHDIAGSKIDIADDDDNQIFVIDVKNPIERYVRVYVDKDTTNAMAESAYYILYGPDYKPQTNDVADAVTTKSLIRAATGTA
jgi:hypothetical protein